MAVRDLSSLPDSALASTVAMAAASAADDASASVGPSPSLAALDPSLSDDYRPVFDREVPIERRLQTDDSVEEIGTLEALRVKVLVQGDEAAPSAVKMELTRWVIAVS